MYKKFTAADQQMPTATANIAKINLQKHFQQQSLCSALSLTLPTFATQHNHLLSITISSAANPPHTSAAVDQ